MLVIISAVSLGLSVLLELSFRISYCTDIFAAVITAHLFSSLNKVWCSKLDRAILSSITGYWERKAPRAPTSTTVKSGPTLGEAINGEKM